MQFDQLKRRKFITLLGGLRLGAGERRRWHTEAQRFGGLEVDEQLELCRLLDSQVGCLLAFENSAGIDADLTERGR